MSNPVFLTFLGILFIGSLCGISISMHGYRKGLIRVGVSVLGAGLLYLGVISEIFQMVILIIALASLPSLLLLCLAENNHEEKDPKIITDVNKYTRIK